MLEERALKKNALKTLKKGDLGRGISYALEQKEKKKTRSLRGRGSRCGRGEVYLGPSLLILAPTTGEARRRSSEEYSEGIKEKTRF